MAISAAAKSNHDQLFGDRVSTLAQSDPELIEYFGNFAFGEVYANAARLTDTPADEVHFQRYLAANCFGDTVGRGGIDLKARELLTFSMLFALGGADAQVRAGTSTGTCGSATPAPGCSPC
jgi:alkylhydroperoxidase/carboxymuconolactone decarboxylase family protein YurZ